MHEPKIVLETIVEPVFLGSDDPKPINNPAGLADNLLRLRLAEIAGQIILNFREGNFFHS
jgi:hypothetical protein